VVRELVQAHGGDVVARSAGRGLGSQFIVNLPLADCARTMNVVAAEAERTEADPRRALMPNNAVA